MLKIINHFKAICIHCLLYTIYATTFHDAHNSDAENISHFIHIWWNLLVGIPKEVQAQIGTVTATSYGQNCHAMAAQPLFTKLYFLLYFKTICTKCNYLSERNFFSNVCVICV
jgi:hypothetical protein